MLKKAFLLSNFIVLSFYSFSQVPTSLTNLPKVVPQSPNTAAFKKFGDIPVSYYTGVPDISIPLYTVSVDNVSVPISINYHASGIKIADEAGRVGLVIDRRQFNYPDYKRRRRFRPQTGAHLQLS